LHKLHLTHGASFENQISALEIKMLKNSRFHSREFPRESARVSFSHLQQHLRRRNT
jgi:hypothetical protein